MKLRDKVALITGGTSGIGFETAKLFRDEGAQVIVTGVDPARLKGASRGIRVNAVGPGPIGTPFHSKRGLPERELKEAAVGIEAQVPLHRFGEAGEIAKAALFLASEDSSFMTGAEIIVDGGLTQF